jgi:hypothetical protein
MGTGEVIKEAAGSTGDGIMAGGKVGRKVGGVAGAIGGALSTSLVWGGALVVAGVAALFAASFAAPLALAAVAVAGVSAAVGGATGYIGGGFLGGAGGGLIGLISGIFKGTKKKTPQEQLQGLQAESAALDVKLDQAALYIQQKQELQKKIESNKEAVRTGQASVANPDASDKNAQKITTKAAEPATSQAMG